MWMLIVLSLLAGVLLPVQAGVNAQLARYVGNPVLAALCSFLVGSLTLLLFTLFLGVRLPTSAQVAQSPPWVWLGGALGAFYVGSLVILAPRLGAATLMSLVISGQMLASLVLDHYGVLGFAAHPLTLWRMLGAIFVVAGMLLIRMF